MAMSEQGKVYYKHEALMRYARLLDFGEIHTKIDRKTGLHAIIAIHSNKLGPAIGGCRLYEYDSAGPAIKDALRLAYMMTLKAAASDLPHGGAKSVILKPKRIRDRKAYFRAFGDFVHEMNGRYITAVDVGSSTEDMDTIAERTPYVIGAPHTHVGESDPSPHTARGVLRGIEAAVKFKDNRDDLEGLHVAIQGAGRVAYYLANDLHERGAKLTVCDPNPAAVQRCINEFNAEVVDTEAIYDVDCDIFAPCALGGTINLDTLNRIKASIVAGSANNQLAHRKYATMIEEKGILYAPDFVVNSGGLINAAMVYDYKDTQLADAKIDKLYDTVLQLFDRARSLKMPTADVAEIIAKERLENNNISKPHSFENSHKEQVQ